MAIKHKSLRQWLRDNGKTQVVFAAENGWAQSLVSKWCNNHPPTLKNALKIKEVTKGEVTPESFLVEDAAA